MVSVRCFDCLIKISKQLPYHFKKGKRSIENARSNGDVHRREREPKRLVIRSCNVNIYHTINPPLIDLHKQAFELIEYHFIDVEARFAVFLQHCRIRRRSHFSGNSIGIIVGIAIDLRSGAVGR